VNHAEILRICCRAGSDGLEQSLYTPGNIRNTGIFLSREIGAEGISTSTEGLFFDSIVSDSMLLCAGFPGNTGCHRLHLTTAEQEMVFAAETYRHPRVLAQPEVLKRIPEQDTGLKLKTKLEDKRVKGRCSEQSPGSCHVVFPGKYRDQLDKYSRLQNLLCGPADNAFVGKGQIFMQEKHGPVIRALPTEILILHPTAQRPLTRISKYFEKVSDKTRAGSDLTANSPSPNGEVLRASNPRHTWVIPEPFRNQGLSKPWGA